MLQGADTGPCREQGGRRLGWREEVRVKEERRSGFFLLFLFFFLRLDSQLVCRLQYFSRVHFRVKEGRKEVRVKEGRKE